MSRIGKLPIPLPAGVQVSLDAAAVTIKGPKGALTHPLPDGITASTGEGRLTLARRDDSQKQRALHGMARAILANAVRGVTQGFSRELEIHGVGYRAQVAGKSVNFALGYTHPVDFPIPEGIQIAVEKQTKITVTGYDRQAVGQVAAKIRALRPPDVYKGKGIRYAGEVLRKKAGKTGAK
jgi:large subunit ribosomal protein L6